MSQDHLKTTITMASRPYAVALPTTRPPARGESWRRNHAESDITGQGSGAAPAIKESKLASQLQRMGWKPDLTREQL